MIITRGFGEQDGVVPVPICGPEMTAQEWGRKNMKVEPCVVVVPCKQ